MPCSLTPTGSERLASIDRSDAVAPNHHKDDPSNTCLSGLTYTALSIAVYASQATSRSTTQDSLPAAGQALPGRT
jgi:hypothetical protein